MAELAELQLRPERRPGQVLRGSARKTEREFLDFVINGVSLWRLCQAAKLDCISCLWLPKIDPVAVNRLLLQAPADLPDGSCSLYVCPECAGVSCGALTVRIEMRADTVIWRDFVFQNDYDPGMTCIPDEFAVLDPVVFDGDAYRRRLLALLT